MTQTEPGYDASRTVQADQPPYRMGFPQGDTDEPPPPAQGGFPGWLVAILAALVVSVGVVLILYYALIKPNINDEVKKDVDALATGQTSSTSSGAASATQGPIVGTALPAITPAPATGTGNSLGNPADLRLAASVAQGQSTSASSPPQGSIVTVPNGNVLSITDVVLSNPNGDSGTIELRQNGKALLSFQLANFRDQDYHFVAPLTFNAGDTVQLFVTCTQVGSGPPGGTVPTTCQDSLFYSGYEKATGATSSASSSSSSS
jgi:hypothetical protein